MATLYSYSRVGSFFTCPTQYAHRYIHKTPSPSPQGIELFMGSRFHDAMEFLYGELPKRLPDLPEVLSKFDQAWSDSFKEVQSRQKQQGYETPLRINREGETVQDYYERAKSYVESYYGKYAPFDQDETLAVEKRVLFSLDPAGQYKMQGYIDRLSRTPDGTLWVHDYKTGSRKLSKEDARNEDQLALYQLGLAQDPAFRKDPVKLAWHFVAFEDDTVQSERGEKELDFLKKKYVNKIQAIEKAKDFAPLTSALCGWCDFLKLCPDGQKAVAQRAERKAKAEGTQAKDPIAGGRVVSKPVTTAKKAAKETKTPVEPQVIKGGETSPDDVAGKKNRNQQDEAPASTPTTPTVGRRKKSRPVSVDQMDFFGPSRT